MDELQIDIPASHQLAQTLKAEIQEWLLSTFTGAEEEPTDRLEVDWHLLGWHQEQLASHVYIIERDILIGGQPYQADGIDGVMTKTMYRRRSFATRLMGAAYAFMLDELHVDLGLLMCDRTLVPYYEPLGWKVVKDRLLYDRTTGKQVFDDRVMILSIRTPEIPEGTIDIQGPPW